MFRTLRLPLGTGLLGLVAQSGAPYYTQDYQSDERFLHRPFIDDAVAGEHIRAILGVPLVPGRSASSERCSRCTAACDPFPSLRGGPADLVRRPRGGGARERPALRRARRGQPLRDRARRRRGGRRARPRPAHRPAAARRWRRGGRPGARGGPRRTAGDPRRDRGALAGTAAADGWQDGSRDAVASGRSVEADGAYVAAALAGTEHVATLVLHGRARPLALAERRTLERGALVTALVLLFARTVAQTEERLGGELLTDLLEGAAPDLLLRERARRQRVVLDPPLSVGVAAVDGLERHAAVRAASRIATPRRGLAGEHRGAVVVLVPGGDPLELGAALREAVRAEGGEATVGVACADGDLAPAYAEARRCLDSLVTLDRSGDVSDPAGLGVTRLLLGENGPAELEEYVASTLGPVLAYDAQRGTSLLETLESWFATGGRVRETAERLHVHPNTVVQRLERVTELLGAAWRDPGRGLDVQLALRVHRLRGGGTTGG